MSDAPPSAVDVVRALGGSALRHDILRHTTEHSLRQAVTSGELRRTSWGTYSLTLSASPQQAAVAARGVLSHATAAAHWQMECWTPADTVHVTVPRRARPAPLKGVRLHYADVAAHEELGGVTSPLRTVVDCAATLPFPEGLAIADSALRRSLVTEDELHRAAAARRGRGRRAVRDVLYGATGLAANPFESVLRAIILLTGAGDFRPQQPIALPGRTIYADLADPELRIAVEADSFTFHGTREALDRDCRRYAELIRADWLPLRFSYEQVAFDPAWIGQIVRDTVDTRRGRELTRRNRP